MTSPLSPPNTTIMRRGPLLRNTNNRPEQFTASARSGTPPCGRHGAAATWSRVVRDGGRSATGVQGSQEADPHRSRSAASRWLQHLAGQSECCRSTRVTPVRPKWTDWPSFDIGSPCFGVPAVLRCAASRKSWHSVRIDRLSSHRSAALATACNARSHTSRAWSVAALTCRSVWALDSMTPVPAHGKHPECAPDSGFE
jgi:hypothetical protein